MKAGNLFTCSLNSKGPIHDHTVPFGIEFYVVGGFINNHFALFWRGFMVFIHYFTLTPEDRTSDLKVFYL